MKECPPTSPRDDAKAGVGPERARAEQVTLRWVRMCRDDSPPCARSLSLWLVCFCGEATAMPTYAYRCEECGESFDRIESISEHGTAKPACPKCGSEKIVSVPTAFVAVTGKKS